MVLTFFSHILITGKRVITLRLQMHDIGVIRNFGYLIPYF